jgi:O-antigen/teichoic acid export membrane protein
VVCVPALVRGLGTDRFGLLSLAWAVAGYFSLFDMGLGRALTKLVADRLGGPDEGEVPELAGTALVALGLLGIAGGVILAACSRLLVERVISVPPALQGEARTAFLLLGLAVPFVVISSGLRAMLDARQRAGVLTAIRVPSGVLSFLAPVAILPFSRSVAASVSALLCLRALACIALGLAVVRAYPSVAAGVAFQRRLLRSLLTIGGWITVSNLVSPLLVTLDRFLIGGLVSIAAVSWYSIPQDLTSGLGVVPGSVALVLFPAFATSRAIDPQRTASLFSAGVKAALLLAFPISLALSAWAPELLSWWVGPEFATNGAPVLRWVAVGFVVNAAGRVAFWLVQGAGRPDLPAKLHVAELLGYLPALWFATNLWGVAGAAAVWTVRVVADTALLVAASGRLVPLQRREGVVIGSMTVAAAFLVAVSGLGAPLGLRLAIFAASFLLFPLASLTWGLSRAERVSLVSLLPRLSGVAP